MKLRALINLLRRTENMLGPNGKNADVWIGLYGSHGALRGVDLRRMDSLAPDVLLRAESRTDDKPIVP